MKQWLLLVRDAVAAWNRDSAPSKGAALSYYTIFSIAPLLFIAISVAGLLFGPDAVQGAVLAQLSDLMGQGGAQAIQEMLANLQRPERGIWGAVVGIALLLVGASTVFGQLQSALDSIWQVPKAAKPNGLWAFVRARLLSFGMVLGMAFVIIVSLLFSTLIAALGKWWGPMFSESLAHLLDLVFSFALLAAVFAMIYRYVPSTHIPWRDVWVGAGVTALLFAVGKWAIGLYLGKSSVTQGFGPFASLVIVMVWVYYSAQIFLLGAEFTWVYAHVFGSRRDMPTDVEEIPVAPAANEPIAQAAAIPFAAPRRRANPAIIAAALLGGVVLRVALSKTPWRRVKRYMFE
jgi:membrane protein